MTDITQKFPPELLVEILGYAPVSDVLRIKKVNRIFRDVVHASPLIQHKIDLFGAGLEYNAAAGVSLADSKKALLQYRSSLESLRPIEKRTVETEYGIKRISDGICAVAPPGKPIRLFTLGSASRGIPHKEWQTPLALTNPRDYDFCLDADVIVFPERGTAHVDIHLRTLSDGEPHPDAEIPTILYSRTDDLPFVTHSISITRSKLVALLGTPQSDAAVWDVVVWDWKSGQVLIKLDSEIFCSAEFIDDCRLLIVHGSKVFLRPSLVLMDTGKFTGGIPVKTTFPLSPHFIDSGFPYLSVEWGTYKPSLVESLAPFYPDPSQRIVMLYLSNLPYYLVFRMGALLDFLWSHEGSVVEWDEWKGHVVIPSINLNRRDNISTWVSGCRLFSHHFTDHNQRYQIDMHDFSIQGRAKYQSKRVIKDLPGIKCLSSTGVVAQVEMGFLFQAHGGHDSIVFSQSHVGEDGGNRCLLRIWTF